MYSTEAANTARSRQTLFTGARLADSLTVGFLAMNYPVATVREVLQAQGTESKRRRGLPNEVPMQTNRTLGVLLDVM